MSSLSIFSRDNAVMPEVPEQVGTWIAAILAAALLMYAINMAVRYRSLTPILLVAAGFCAVPLESIATLLGHAYHAPIAQHTLYEAYERPIPQYVGFVYVFYFGGLYVLSFPKMLADSFGPRFLWKVWGISVLLAYLIEIVPVGIFHMWTYRGYQPLWIWRGGMPAMWAFLNVGSIFVPLALITHMCQRYLFGIGRIFVLLLSPMAAIGTHIGTGFAFYTIRNSAYRNSPFWMELAGLITVGLSVFVVWLSITSLTHQGRDVSIKD